MKTIKSLILFLIVAVIFPLTSQAAGLSVSEAVIADPDQEIAEMAISGEQQPIFGSNLFMGH